MIEFNSDQVWAHDLIAIFDLVEGNIPETIGFHTENKAGSPPVFF
mgnify:CR=1 FL=1